MEHCKQFAQGLVSLFFPLVECTVFDLDGHILEVFNAFSTIKEDQECDLKKLFSG